ncbi:MAG TPA: sigma 54-interacting transcriptional regulator [Candidatus Deferrimicrobiaceae bacterium]|jgi:transcriptional regulator with GAF, ATPase, and Fis domain
MIPAEHPAKLSVSISSGMTVEIRLGVREVRIGRGPEADLQLPDPSVSRLHARIFRVGEQYFLSDASRNGTFLDNARITQIPLESGQVFRIGPYQIHFINTNAARCSEALPTLVNGYSPAIAPFARPKRAAPSPTSVHPLGIVGKSIGVQRLLQNIRKVALSDFPILVEGETGCGKELVSRGIHDLSSRSSRPFVVVNCGAISADLIESELFGHEKGSFTGATSQRKGAFEIADSGTIFLDEIGELPLSLQPKLLRVLEQKEFKRVGGNDSILTDVRILAATNRNLKEEIRLKTFRDDLYFRVGSITLTIPPLRDRSEDVPLVARHFLESMSPSDKRPVPSLSDDAAAFLSLQEWPGNVRELRNAIQRAVVMSEHTALLAEDFAFLAPSGSIDPGEAADPSLSRWEQSEKSSLQAELIRQQWNKTATARSLGIAKSTLFEKLKRYAIRTPGPD